MIRTTKALYVLALLLVVSPAGVLAQGAAPAVPKRGDMAVSGNLGFAHSFDDEFDGFEALFSGTFEYYSSDRISWRGLLGFTDFDFDPPGSGPGGSVDVMFINANILYNWNEGVVRPYVTGGIGLYDEDPDGPGIDGDGDIEIGINGGGGLDIFFQPQWAIKIEGTLHGISGDGPDTVFAGTGGVKFHF